MKRMLAASIALTFGLGAWAQAPAPTADDAAAKKAADRKAKQEMVQGTTQKATTQFSAAPNRGPAPPSQQAAKPTTAERQEINQAVNKQIGASQIGPSAGAAAKKVPKDAPKAAKPDLSDPKIREAMEKQKP
ncbi:MAG: hypothetical protein IT517_15110 [Burkholderiales bacterium]|nr:hypothetical protein [Burkholderiales bacterium]MCC7218105.1 hypothetical protein [Burkholderiales bacterium]